MSKKEDRSPFHPFSEEEVQAAENGTYYIQLDNDIFSSENGKMAFNKERAEFLYQQIWDGLIELKKNGDMSQKDDAVRCLTNLRMYPLRIH